MRWTFASAFMCLVATTLAAQPSTSSTAVPPHREDYKIGIEDSLRISVWGEPNLGHTVRVRPDGKMTFPLVNDIAVVGLTPDAVRRLITERLAEYINEPNVTVIVEEINSYKVYIIGKVGSQGTFNFYRPTRLLQAIANAGGFNEFSKQQVTVLRDKGVVEARIVINVKRLVAGDPAAENIFLMPGDTVIVE